MGTGSAATVVPPTSATTSLLSLVVFDRLIVLPGTVGVLARDFVRCLFTGPAAIGRAIEPRDLRMCSYYVHVNLH